MAITNAQQYQQLVKKRTDGKRPGYVGKDYGDQAKGKGAYSGGDSSPAAGGTQGGGTKSGNQNTGGGSNDDKSSKYQTYNTAKTIFDATGQNPTGYDLSKGPPPLTEKEKQFVKDNPPKRTLSDFLNPLKRTYNMFPNNPKNEKAYIRYLQSQGVTLPQDILEMLDEDDKTGKLTYDQFNILRNLNPKDYFDYDTLDPMISSGEGKTMMMDFPSYMASKGNFGLITKGNLGNLKDFKNPGTILDPTTGLPMSDLAFEKLKQSSSQYSIGNNDRANEQQDPCLGPNPPAYCAVNNDPTEEEDPTQLLTPRILGSQFDPTFFANKGGRAGYMDGGIMEDTPEGGIMDLESGRQMYFLGKLVKKATRAVKKIVKSPIGKAALFAAPFAMSGGSFGAGLGKFFGKGSLNPFLAKSIGGDTMFSGLGSILSKTGLVGKAGLPTLKGGLALTSLLPLLAGKEEDDFDIDAYYAANKLTPGTTKRQMGSEFDFYNYNLAEGGMPSKEPVAKKTMPLLDIDDQEMDLRAEGGFVPIGRMERADDVPARLSKNEFVFTADAVRNAGEGDIDKGAEVMYNMMKNLESGGEVSEESQGLDGAREMFQTSKRLEEVL